MAEPKFKVVEGWGQLPEGWAFKQVAGVAVGADGQVYVFNRSDHPMLIFSREGELLSTWGEPGTGAGQFLTAHGICLTPEGNLWLVDRSKHAVELYTPEGAFIRALSAVDRSGLATGETVSDGLPFGGPTDVAMSPSGLIYVSDGYDNRRVHQFSAEGELLHSWGEEGTGPGQFSLPHSVWVGPDETVYVADRENHRIQLFSPEGEYQSEWGDLIMPTDLYLDDDGLMYVTELTHRVSILNLQGNVVARWGGQESWEVGQFVAPHAAWTDSRGDLYIGEVLEGQRIQKFARVG